MISRIFRGEIENVAVKRKRQIDTLKIFNDNVIELRENVDYQVEFQAGDRRMAIMVSLSPNFPLEKPVLRVSPPISHPWCNEHSEITSAPGLLNVSRKICTKNSSELYIIICVMAVRVCSKT
ncbi:vacuolar protein sorting-associated protein 37A-like, partial [Temnothorax curvispinosus]|uniref:Vacuolar protein sorting-associated protein 37A-like n=1 Tax=Temnothorax curvispinosus TaxID=300111 RepID=A0A6J1Q1J1_9HYME